MRKISIVMMIVILVLFSLGCEKNEDSTTDSLRCDINNDGRIDAAETRRCNQTNMDSESKCGDGVCGLAEMTNNLCPKDCKSNTSSNGVIAELLAPTQPIKIYDFHELAGNQNKVVLKLFNPVVDEENHRLYVVGSKTTNIVAIDTLSDEIVDSFDIGTFGGFLMFDSGKLYNYNFQNNLCHEIDPKVKETKNVSLTICTSLVPKTRNQEKIWKDYSFIETGYQTFTDGTTGFPTNWTQDLNGAYGIIEIRNSEKRKVGEILHGPDALYFTIDYSTDKLYTTNTGDGSVSVFDLTRLEETNYCKDSSCKIKDLDVGTSADQIIVDSDGKIYFRNRIGGSTIYVYNEKSGKFSVIDNENHKIGGIGLWPSGMALNSEKTRIYVLSHYDARIDVIDAQTLSIIDIIRFDTETKPRTDSISELVFDDENEKLFASYPELGVIGVVDGKKSEILGMIDLTDYGFVKKANGGPNLIKMHIDKEFGVLIVLLTETKKKLFFDIKTLSLLSDSDASIKKEYYNKFNGATYELKTRMISEGVSQTLVYEIIDGEKTRQCALDRVVSGINPVLEFDYENNIFYAAYFETGIVKKYDISGCSEEVTQLAQTSPPPSQNQNIPTISQQSAQGKCGDGVCGPIEKDNNLCTEDCG